MSRRTLPAVLLLLVVTPLLAAPLTDYLPPDVRYAETVPRPSEVLGHEIGEWHVRHDALLAYLRSVADGSDRVKLEIQGTTHEGRPLALLTITSPRNHARLEQIRKGHLEGVADSPVVIWLGYSIHGNEASGSNAALLTVYHLAAARGEAIDHLLEHAVILIDPSLNPDGLGRFATWVNSHRGAQPVADPNHREHHEAWPGGRTNHYWFDLNRDWLLVQQPESRARVATFRRWHPHLLGDFHEMGSHSTYFFQPGVPSRTHPLTPPRNLELTRQIAKFHAAALDEDGTPYYTEETFDDFYYGKGSTYPDANGSIGILFEQASVRGHVQQTAHGVRRFRDAIRNQFRTSLSMFEAGLALRSELAEYRRDFYRDALQAARANPVRGWLLTFGNDAARRQHLLELLDAHGILAHELARDTTLKGLLFRQGEALIVPVEQKQTVLASALFERRTEFADSTFYDVSAWTLPLAMGARVIELDRKSKLREILGAPLTATTLPTGDLRYDPQDVAWILPWDGYYAPRALGRLLAADVQVNVAGSPLRVPTAGGIRSFGRGSLVVRASEQSISRQKLHELFTTIVRDDGIDVVGARSGLTPEGADLGSPSLQPLKMPRPLLVTGTGMSSTGTGEIWHLLDYRFGLELPMIDGKDLNRNLLKEYSHVIMADGSPGGWGKSVHAALREFVEDGGTLIASQGAARWSSEKLFEDTEAESADSEKSDDEKADPPILAPVSYADYDQQRAVDQISGAIFQIQIDTTHPLGYGYSDPHIAVFKSSAKLPFDPSANPYENVALYSSEPLLSGYASSKNVERFVDTVAIRVGHHGRGRTILFADNLNFRAYWFGTSKLFANALFFGNTIRHTRWNDRD